MKVPPELIICLLHLVLYAFADVINDYPESVPVFNVRVDSYSKKPVTSGHLHTMSRKVKRKDFKKILQCSLVEPDFDYNSGSMSLLRSIPPTKEILELMCAYAENKCNPWAQCQADRIAYKMNPKSIPASPFKGFSFFQRFRMFRVINGVLYYDWPWGVERFNYTAKNNFLEINEILPLMDLVLERISDMPDSVFYAGCENPALPYNFPFPIFSSSTSSSFVDMPWPWMEAIKSAKKVYYDQLKSKNQFAYDPVKALNESRTLWIKKIPKAAFFASYDGGRMIMFDAARRNPDLFDASFAFPYHACIGAWNPTSKERCFDGDMLGKTPKEVLWNASTSTASGFALPLVNISEGRPYRPVDYKYVIVPMGGGSLTTSGRLAGLLATSGAVILLQRTSHVYHFSARLKPWVHYVPLSYSGADVAEKVRWLRDHDDLARQIAENGRSFARSYLRLEDYYCYGAAALEMVGELERGSDVLEANKPQPLNRMRHHLLQVNTTGNGAEDRITYGRL